jgi:hypothetical protein
MIRRCELFGGDVPPGSIGGAFLTLAPKIGGFVVGYHDGKVVNAANFMPQEGVGMWVHQYHHRTPFRVQSISNGQRKIEVLCSGK